MIPVSSNYTLIGNFIFGDDRRRCRVLILNSQQLHNIVSVGFVINHSKIYNSPFDQFQTQGRLLRTAAICGVGDNLQFAPFDVGPMISSSIDQRFFVSNQWTKPTFNLTSIFI